MCQMRRPRAHPRKLVNAFTKAVAQVQVVIGRQGDQLLSNEAGDITRCARLERSVPYTRRQQQCEAYQQDRLLRMRSNTVRAPAATFKVSSTAPRA